MSEFQRTRNRRELSIGYFNLPKIGGVYEISSKERERPSLRLKAPHIQKNTFLGSDAHNTIP